MRKVTLHIPTETYGFVAVEMEGTPEEVMITYREYADAFKPKEGLGDKEYNAFINKMLLNETNHVEEYNQMNEKQKYAVQVIKRGLKRLEAKNN